MRMYIENIIQIDKVAKEINTIFEYELKECKRIELELRSNVGDDKYLLDNIWNKIYVKLNSEAKANSSYKKQYTNIKIANGMCEYSIKIFDKDSNYVGA